MGKIYFLTDGVNIKIGFTKQPIEKRIIQLSTGSSKKLFCLGYFQGTMQDEQALHRKFGGQRLRSDGEWFSPATEIIDYINNVNEESNVFVENGEQGLMKYKTMPL